MRTISPRPILLFLMISALIHGGFFLTWQNQINSQNQPFYGNALNLNISAAPTTPPPQAPQPQKAFHSNPAKNRSNPLKVPDLPIQTAPAQALSTSQLSPPHPKAVSAKIGVISTQQKTQRLNTQLITAPTTTTTTTTATTAKTTTAARAQSSTGRKPHYPRRAIKKHQQGVVILRFTLRANGRATDIQIVKSSGHFLLDKTVLKFVKKETFHPMLANGIAVDSKQQYRYQFELTQ